ncbi:TonB-dependent receptor [Compostibacter hankyongensis]|uniref:TonB-dependent receptor n=1 Tax=Compostibacter hankyongensis TaxID=1007089 RepID=A0ABP8G9N0_9BACT
MPVKNLYLKIPWWITQVLLTVVVSAGAARAQTISGTVRSAEKKEPLSGVTIQVKGAANGTTTDMNGRYSLSGVKPSDSLSFSSVGFQKETVSVNGRTQLDISLSAEASSLDQLVVIGYGREKKSSLTAAISRVENDILDQIPTGRIENALAGRLAGVNISNTVSSPGATPIIRIRGLGSISASNNPLVVIDGFPGGSLANINMNDVASIEVLKDASSAAIYGSRGSGGVIIVTTKSGRTGKPKLSFNAFYGSANAIGHHDWITGQEFYDYQVRYKNRDFANAGGDVSLPVWGDDRRPATYQVNPVIKEGNTIWEDVLLNPAPIQNYHLSLSGGTENVRYYVSGGLKDEQGTLINTWYKTYSVRAKVDVKINNVVSAGFLINPEFSKRRTSPVTMEAIAKMPPFLSPKKNPDGTYPKPLDYWGTSVSAGVSPLAVLYGTHNISSTFNSLGEVYLDLNLLEGLKFRTSLDANIAYSTGENYQAASATTNSVSTGSSADTRNINLINENVLSYDKTFNGIHSLNAILGASYQKTTSRNAYLGVLPGSFNNDIIETLNNATISPTASGTSKSQWGLVSYFGRINYGFKDRYLVSASYRTDGSSRFGPRNRWGSFPSVSAAWRISQEDFFRNVPVISNLKIRASYGIAGNFNIGDFQYLGKISDTYYSPDGELTKGQAQSNFGNAELQWEKTKSTDLGIELGLFSDRLNFVFDYYDKRTYGLLYNVGIPAVSGFTSSLVNVGDIGNKGFELEINSVNLDGAFKWQTSFNLSHDKNKVLDLGGVDEVINTHSRGMSWLLRIGEPMFSYYGYKLIGVLQDQEDVDNSPVLPGSKPGNGKYEDVNGDGQITPDDKVILGNFQPSVFMGMVNNFSWKNFDLSIALQSSIGAKMYDLENLYYEGPTVCAMRLSLIENQWWSEAEPGDGKTPSTALSELAYVANSDYYIENASFLAVRNVNLGYTFPTALANRLHLNTFRVYLSASNLLMITSKDFHGYNPEGYTMGEVDGIGSMPGFNNGATPINRTFVFGVNVVF